MRHHAGIIDGYLAIDPSLWWDKAKVVQESPETIFEILAHGLTTPNRYPDAVIAFKVLNLGLKYQPESPFLHEKLGAAHELNKEPRKASAADREALRLKPGNKTAEKKIRQLQR